MCFETIFADQAVDEGLGGLLDLRAGAVEAGHGVVGRIAGAPHLSKQLIHLRRKNAVVA